MKRRDAAKRAWFAAGRPGPLAAFRLSFAASRRKRKKRASRRGPVRKTFGEGPFTRVVAGAGSYEGPPRWDLHGRRMREAALQERLRALPRGELEALAIANIRQRLDSLDLDPDVQAELSRIDSARWYAVELLVRSYHAAEDQDGEPQGYAASRRRIRFVGIGKTLWFKIANVAEVSEIEGASVKDVSGRLSQAGLKKALGHDESKRAWALWANPRASVGLAGGGRFEGRGDFYKWKRERDKRAGGRPRKARGGGLTYEEARRIGKADAEAARRATATAKKAAELRAQGKHAEARRLEARASARRSATTAATVKGRGVFARVTLKKAGKRRKSKRRGR